MKSIWIVMTLLSGAFLPLQGGINARLGKSIASPVHASLVSFLVGAAALFSYILITRQPAQLPGLKTAPWYLWTGGLLGAFYVTVIILAFPRIGAPLTFGLVVAGQMIAAVLLDHFGILVTGFHPVNAWKLLGVALVIAGVVIIRKF
jgi:transporter family-2 protein